MGGRGASGLNINNQIRKAKKQLKQAAKDGKMPATIVGNSDFQKAVFEEIDKLYPMPKVKTQWINETANYVTVNVNGKVKKAYYASDKPTKAEKNGVLKWMLWKEQ